LKVQSCWISCLGYRCCHCRIEILSWVWFHHDCWKKTCWKFLFLPVSLVDLILGDWILLVFSGHCHLWRVTSFHSFILSLALSSCSQVGKDFCCTWCS
jgi:hypothetical protein